MNKLVKILRYEDAPCDIEYDKYDGILVRCGSKHMVINCHGTGCHECMHSKKVYHACPGCGLELTILVDSICQCGTWLSLCGGEGSVYTVAEYIIPSEAAREMIKTDDAV